MSLFEKASRQKVRFDSPKGFLTSEDLWDLPLTSTVGKANLDDIARGLNRQLKDNTDESFVTPVVNTNSGVQLKLDIVKHVIGARIAERDAAALEADRRVTKQKILEAIDKKKDEALSGASLEELQKKLEAL